MKRVVKTRAAIVAAAMITGAIASPPVLAGEYVFDRLETADGETYESTRNPTTEAWYPGSIGSASVYATGSSVSVSAHSKGKVRAVFKWQGDDPQDNPPQDGTLYVKVTSMAYLGVSGEQFYDIEIDNGFGAPVVNYTSQGVHLVQSKTNGQQEVKTPFITLKAKGRAEGNDGAWVGAYLSYNAEKDNRGVKITRSDAPAPKQKGAPGVVIDESKDEWIDVDGTGHGHSIYTYLNTYQNPTAPSPHPYPNPPVTVTVPNVQTFNAVRSGTWIGPLSWQWTPSEDGSGTLPADDINTHQQEMPNGTANLEYGAWAGTPSGTSQKIITYDLTDGNDGAKVKARYYLTLHDPWEVVIHNTATAKRDYRPHPYGGWVEASEDNDTLTGDLTQSHEMTVGVTFSGPPIGDLIGIDVSASYTVSTGVTVGNEHNNVRAGYRSRVYIWDEVIRHTGTADEWNKSGYVGNTPFQYDAPATPTVWGMHLGPLEWNGSGPEPPEGPFVPED